MKNIDVLVQPDFDEKFWDTRTTPRPASDLYSLVRDSLKVFKFSVLNKQFSLGLKSVMAESSSVENENLKTETEAAAITSLLPSGTLYFVDQHSTFSSGGIKNHPSEQTQFETANPVYLNVTENHTTPRSNDNVAELRSLIFEFDDTPLEHQKELAEKGPVARAVFSGSKSVHCKVILQNPAETIEEYKYWWNLLNEDYFERRADKQCSDPCRLTRCPGAVHARTGKVQELLFERDVVYENDPALWRGVKTALGEEQKQKKFVASQQFVWSDDVDWREKLEKVKTPAGENARQWPFMGDGQRHQVVWSVIGLLKTIGCPEEECVRYVSSNGIKDNVRSMVRKIYRL
jgi:hypothetical protein